MHLYVFVDVVDRPIVVLTTIGVIVLGYLVIDGAVVRFLIKIRPDDGRFELIVVILFVDVNLSLPVVTD